MSPYTSYVVETLITVGALGLLAFVVLYGGRRLGAGRGSGAIALVGHLPLDARRTIYLVRVGAQVLVVGVGEGGFAKLGELPAADLPAPPEVTPPPFAAVLARLRGERPHGGGEK